MWKELYEAFLDGFDGIVNQIVVNKSSRVQDQNTLLTVKVLGKFSFVHARLRLRQSLLLAL